jgi:hypothetical protein
LSAPDANQLKREINSTKDTARERETRCSNEQRREKNKRNKQNNNKNKINRKYQKKTRKIMKEHKRTEESQLMFLRKVLIKMFDVEDIIG